MNPIVKKDILNILRESVSVIKQGELFKLKELSDHVIHNATIFQDQYSITIAVTIYSMSKIYQTKPGGPWRLDLQSYRDFRWHLRHPGQCRPGSLHCKS